MTLKLDAVEGIFCLKAYVILGSFLNIFFRQICLTFATEFICSAVLSDSKYR
jgi:hypothetical protein